MIAIVPILAANVEILGLIIFIVIGIISWLTNMANQAKQPPQPPARAPRPPRQNDKLSQEIDIFLQEVSGKRKPQAPDRRIEVEVIPDDEARKKRVERRPARPPQRPQRQPQVQQPAPKPKPVTSQSRVRPGQELAERHNIDPSGLGTTLQSHLNTYMSDDRIGKEVQQYLKRDVEQSVEQHLGTFGASTTGDRLGNISNNNVAEKAGNIVRLLREPASIRNAILVNEVLGKPVGLRKRP